MLAIRCSLPWQGTMKKIHAFIFLLGMYAASQAQVIMGTRFNETDPEIRNAIDFYKKYLSEFDGQHLPDYSAYWSDRDCKRFKVPDHIVYSISSDVPTYHFGDKKTIFSIEKYPDFVLIKTKFTQNDSSGNVTLFASTNHYVGINDSSKKPQFISPLTINSAKLTTVVNKNITYHFPAGHMFNKCKSDSLVTKIEAIEKAWGFQKININYYFADSKEQLAMMKGLDYYWGMEDTIPAGMAFDEDKLVFCSGYGENYLHEVLHLYFNPLYKTSPVNHGLIYYLAGGMGHDFNWMIHRMNDYLSKYPETDLSQFQTLASKDNMLHIDHTVMALICKMIDEREGIAGLKRLLTYSTIDKLFMQEFFLKQMQWDGFLKRHFKNENMKH